MPSALRVVKGRCVVMHCTHEKKNQLHIFHSTEKACHSSVAGRSSSCQLAQLILCADAVGISECIGKKQHR